MTQRKYTVLIIGAGVAGLSAAIALERAGHVVKLFERKPEIQPVGAGLILWSNAFAALRALGLADEIVEIGQPLSHLAILDSQGRTLSGTDARSISERVGSPTVALSRAELMPLLSSQLAANVINTNHALERYEQRADKVIAHFADGTAETGDVLIGADGIWSTVRSQVHGQEPARYSGYTAWRGLVDNPVTSTYGADRSTESWGTGLRFGWVPLTKNRVYWFAVKNAPEGESPAASGHRAELLDLFGDWHSPIPETIEAMPEAQILRHDIYDRLPARSWGIGPTTLSGDAAHPMTPNTGQGAAQAIEDAVVLADCLSRYQTINGALRAYEHTRIPRTRMITQLSWRIGQASQISNPLAVRLRDTVARAMPDSIGARQIESVVNWRPPPVREESI